MTDEAAPKRLRVLSSEIADVGSLQGLLEASLPDKKAFISQWIADLAQPSVCIETLEDVRRLDPEDIGSLPVPPIVKGLFREVLSRESDKTNELQKILDATNARAKAVLAPLRDRNMQPPLAGSRYFQDQKNYRLILTREEIDTGVRIVAHRIETWCKGERVVLVGILKGAFMFMSDLCRALHRPYSVYFVEASSYKEGRTQANSVQVGGDVNSSKFVDETSKKPHKILLVDELLDNGKTMHDMKQHFLENLKDTHAEKDILTVCLFSKERSREHPEADITGIPNLPDVWLVGYGLDDRGTKRGWSELFAVPKVKIVSTIEKDEVDKLLIKLDDAGILRERHIFAGFELACDHKLKFRVNGLDVHGSHSNASLSLQRSETKVTSKADIQRALSGLLTVKGKYEHELQFAFIADGVSLVVEDEIFYGNNQAYAHMRRRLRRQIEESARRCGVSGISEPLHLTTSPL